MIEFGGYDHPVKFISWGEVTDEHGGFYPEMTTLLRTLASVYQMKGGHDLDAAQLELPKTFVFKVQYRSGFEPNESMQIDYKGSNYAIKSIVEDADRNQREWIITAVKV